ncbi:hypothetical protein KUM39_00245 [Streptomyces sp. J2-1]|uniref:hypothetical protein n=1 Tax=Streptomyces corallincola TaxID=2851888 RepID=UPI001C38556A|nr:hypothetical protein [Streptomyces corallincola]MBV2352798.1 hypothetical protein [Streptomyces corallincola]
MTSPHRPDGPLVGQDAARLANEAEGFLLLHAEREQARREAVHLCDRLPWLTGGQAEDLTARYCEQRLGLTRQALQATADRAKRLRGEYETRYRDLRRSLLCRHVALACVWLVGSTVTSAMVCLTAR